jgi:hypothetical protein
MAVASERFPARFSPYRGLCGFRSFEHPLDNEFPDDPAVRSPVSGHQCGATLAPLRRNVG